MAYWLKSLLVSASLLLTLTACDEAGPSQSFSLATVPADIRMCVVQLTGAPAAGSMTRAQAAELIFRLRQSELRLSSCGQRILALYDSQANSHTQGATQNVHFRR